jgi:hypothetical protein
MARAKKVEETTEAVTANPKAMSSYAPSTCRAGTARHAAYMAIELAFELGATRAETLAAVKQAEIDWHAEQGRVVKGIAPAGWLKLFACQFGGEA